MRLKMEIKKIEKGQFDYNIIGDHFDQNVVVQNALELEDLYDQIYEILKDKFLDFNSSQIQQKEPMYNISTTQPPNRFSIGCSICSTMVVSSFKPIKLEDKERNVILCKKCSRHLLHKILN